MAIEVKHTTQATGTDAGNGEIAKAQWNEAHTLNMASGNLLGRTTAGAGPVEEISVGTGLSLSGGVLAATGGGSSTLTIQNKTAAYTVVAGDLGTIINCTSGTFTVSLTATATLGAGFNCWVWNTSNTATDAVTIDPNGSETIDGVSTLILRRGEGTQIICDGTNWQTGDKKTMRGYAENISSGTTRATAFGLNSIGIGANANSGSNNAIAIGASSYAGGTNTIVLGANVSSTGNYQTGIGHNSSGAAATLGSNAGAMALGGSYASGTDSFAAAVANNTSSYGATGANSIAIGYRARATGAYSISLSAGADGGSAATGDYAFAAIGGTASAIGSISIGRGAIASGAATVAIGRGYAGASSNATTNQGATCLSGGTASGVDSFAAVGGTATQKNSIAFGPSRSDIIGKFAYSAISTISQTAQIVLGRSTTDATATVLTSDNAAAAATNQVILPNNSAYAFTGIVVARQQAAGGTQSAAWEVKGLIRREGTAASTVLVNSALTVIDNQPGWTLALSADTTNGGLAITATGAAATNIRWVATIQTSEVTYA